MAFPRSSLKRTPGAAPGIEHDEIANLPGGRGLSSITCIDYCPAQVMVQEIGNLDEFVKHHRPDWSIVRWISVDGLTDMHAIQVLAAKYNLHPLAIEDLVHTTQRPKIDSYGGEESEYQARLFIVTRLLYINNRQLQHEQISVFLGHNTVLTFQETCRPEWESIRQRIKAKGSRLRDNDASFLVYSLLDVVVDNCFPILEFYSDRAEELAAIILEKSDSKLITEIHQLKRDLLQIHRVIWPMREVISSLLRDQHECISDDTRVYLRDLYDHIIQILEITETYREIASDLIDNYMSSISNRMNEIMKVLTLIGTIFIPLTFLAGVYGMNFRHFPELDQVWAYPAFWFVCFLAALVMVLVFRRRKWL